MVQEELHVSYCGCNTKPSFSDGQVDEAGATVKCQCFCTVEKQDSNEGKHARLSKEKENFGCSDPFTTFAPTDLEGVCACCKNECKEIGTPVLFYELPTPKFEGQSVSQRDYCWKPLPRRDLPAWHPVRKDMWRSPNVPSVTESVYMRDFTPPVVIPCTRKPVYYPPKKDKKKKQVGPQAPEDVQVYERFRKIDNDEPGIHRCCDNAVVHHKHVPTPKVAFEGTVTVQKDDSGKTCCQNSKSCKCADTQQGYSLGCETQENVDCCNEIRANVCPPIKYWWKRTCCEPIPNYTEPPKVTFSEPACPNFVTTHVADFKHPDAYKEPMDRPEESGYSKLYPREDSCPNNASNIGVTVPTFERGGII